MPNHFASLKRGEVAGAPDFPIRLIMEEWTFSQELNKWMKVVYTYLDPNSQIDMLYGYPVSCIANQ